MAFPHPKSRKEHYRNDDKPNTGGVLWNFFQRTINIPEYRNAKDDVNPAKNRTFGGLFHDFGLSSISRRYREWPILCAFLSAEPILFQFNVTSFEDQPEADRAQLQVL
jgi:hypothetical protein